MAFAVAAVSGAAGPYGGASWHSQAQGSRGRPGGDSRDGAVYDAPHSPLSVAGGEVAIAQGRHDGAWPADEGCRTLIRRQAWELHWADFEHKTRRESPRMRN